jgi:hypothetical protein
MKIIKRLLKALGIVGVVLIVALGVTWGVLSRADGPTGPIPGGELVSGELVEDPNVDWTPIFGTEPVGEIELQLEAPVGSRITGAFLHEGDLYVPCDLGYMWRRVPDGTMRGLLRVIWFFKDWHENALLDGRVVLRIDGKRYRRQAVRISDPALETKFRADLSRAAGEFFGGLLPIETDPDDIWFFRLDPPRDQSAAG